MGIATDAETAARQLADACWLKLTAMWDDSPEPVRALAAIYLARELCQQAIHHHHLTVVAEGTPVVADVMIPVPEVPEGIMAIASKLFGGDKLPMPSAIEKVEPTADFPDEGDFDDRS